MAPAAGRPLIGRDAELDDLLAGLGERHVLLSGDAGVGKTRLLLALREAATETGWRVVAGHCLDFGDDALPYLPFTEILDRLAADLPELVASVIGESPALARLLPGPRHAGSSGGPGDVHRSGSAGGRSPDRAELFAAVHGLLESAAEEAPLLLVIEDCHWADRSTRELLSFLFTRPFEARVAIVASYRSDDLHRRHPLRRAVAEWSRLARVDRVPLAPLPDDDVRDLVAELAPTPISGAGLAAIVRRAEGNAFFVEELVGAETPVGDLPEDLADLLLVRLDRLGDTARQVVRSASVAGRRVGHDLLALVSGLDRGDLEVGVREAVEMNVLVHGDGTYTFRHALLAEVVYDDLLPGERVRLHERYAAALVAQPGLGAVAELARHARLANDLDTAATASVRAGREALHVGGPDEAARHFEQALALLTDAERRRTVGLDVAELAVAAAQAHIWSGRPELAADLLAEQLRLMPDDAAPTERARLLCTRADALLMLDTGEDPVAVSEEAVELSHDDAGALRASVLGLHARALFSSGRAAEAEDAGLEALALAERLDLHELAADITTTLSWAAHAGTEEQLVTALRDAVDRAHRAGAVHSELRARFRLARTFQDRGQLGEAATWFESAMELGARAGLPWAPYSFESRWQLAWVCYAVGDWDQVLRLTDPGSGPVPQVPAALLASVQLLVEVARGALVGDRARVLRAIWEVDGGVAVNSATAELVEAARAGGADAARSVYREVTAFLGAIWHEWFSARVRLAAVTAAAIGDEVGGVPAAERAPLVAAADDLLADGEQVLAKYADPVGFWGPEGRAWHRRLAAETLRVHWLAGIDPPDQDTLREAWRDTERLFDEYGHVYETAAVRATLAAILRATGDPGEARGLAAQAREVAVRLGAQPLVDRLREQGSTGRSRRSDLDPSTAALTPRETEILALVAAGRSNGEIGTQLFIATKTVSVHVSNILAKLGASGRTEAAAIAHRRGLLDDGSRQT